jgi:hypothetical protein
MSSGPLCEKKDREEGADEGERWGCLVQDRESRFVIANASGPVGEELIARTVDIVVQRTHGRPFSWLSDGWKGYEAILRQAYRQRVRTGKPGRPPWVVPFTLTLTQIVKHRDERGHLLSVETRVALGTSPAPAGTVHVERLNGALRDRLAALTRKTHAFAKRDDTWDALVGLQLFDHNFHRPHQALRLPLVQGPRRYQRRSPAMALSVTDHLWSFQDLLTFRLSITSQ